MYCGYINYVATALMYPAVDCPILSDSSNSGVYFACNVSDITSWNWSNALWSIQRESFNHRAASTETQVPYERHAHYLV